MMESKTVVLTDKEEKLANLLFDAYKNNQPLNMNDYKDWLKDDDSAYRVQDRLMHLKKEAVGGYKVSLTSKQTQDMFKATEPLYGAQVKSRFVTSPVDVDLSKLNEPLAEVELEFTCKEQWKVTDSVEDLLKKSTVASGVEVPDARFTNWFPSLPKYLVMADAAVGGLVVAGQSVDGSKLNVNDLAKVTCELWYDDKKLKDGKASEVLGNPLNSLRWLVQKLHSQNKDLKVGQQVSTGTFLLPEKLTAGKWVAKFSNGFSDVVLNVK